MGAHVLQVVGGVLLEQGKRLILKVILNLLTLIAVAVVNSNHEQPFLDKVDGGTTKHRVECKNEPNAKDPFADSFFRKPSVLPNYGSWVYTRVELQSANHKSQWIKVLVVRCFFILLKLFQSFEEILLPLKYNVDSKNFILFPAALSNFLRQRIYTF